MENDKKNGEEEKGFVVKDKRFSAKKEEKQETQAKQETEKEVPPKEASTPEGPLPEIDFTHFIFSLSTSALIQLGEVQDPFTKKAEKDLPLAKQTIDLIAMLKEKTKGNLTSDEAKIVEHILYDLRMRYVKAST